MSWTKTPILGALLFLMSLSIGCRGAEPAPAPDEGFSGARALEHVKTQVELCPRPPGSEAAAKLRAWLVGELEALGYTVEEQAFTAKTPRGEIRMVNVLARQPGSAPGWIALAAHYDTKVFDEFRFVGANDGGSGVAVLVELARLFAAKPLKHGLMFLFLDGEEAQVEWSEADSLYGSRFLASQWVADGTAKDVRALFVLDMVGDRNLKLTDDLNSHPQLKMLLRAEAKRLGLEGLFTGPSQPVDDDHIPFAMARIPAVDVIGFATSAEGVYPSYWHTEDDTLDKVSPESLQAVGRVVEAAVRRLDGMLSDPPPGRS